MRKLLTLYTSLLIAATVGNAQAQVRIEISGVGSHQIPVAVATFANEGVSPQKVSEIIKADLERSGAFKIIDANTVSDVNNIDYSGWKAKGANALVVGTIDALANGRYDVRYRLFDTIKQEKMSNLDKSVTAQFTRLSAHLIADDVFLKLTGIRGIFSTRISYVKEEGGQYLLMVADADGENEQLALRSNESIISPSWSPDGTKLAYVSFEQNKPVVYVQNLITRARTVVANEKGNNSAPAWAPSGNKLAVALSKDGHTQIYTVNADGSGLRRISNSADIDTEPQWSADGQSIYFTSNRSNSAQIYRMNPDGGEAKRVTFSSGEKTSPRISADGKTLAYISHRDGNYQLFTLDLASSQEQRLSDATDDESPSFAANGKYILYATRAGDRKSLAVVSVDGLVKQRLTTKAGDIKEPAWGPYMQ
ncbi:Tol-Pal system beta propeller repeat protein TolB [Pseudoduganella aquatica]|uniref:Tol-Pal system protein TolB n=1 Tax=Pseudoduganella aquatica TaxID=2660641 RepID=A0A7X4HAK9_9BURK|nr:Tol-Pal system beta propeller repeat protein TolB [Pseudoduganella aquatica]MYN06797.1 Tol-Pal system protein TolB [Pseudoduganella aquatica]